VCPLVSSAPYSVFPDSDQGFSKPSKSDRDQEKSLIGFAKTADRLRENW
jgi:hypothetical protein